MIRILGARRILLLFILIVLNAGAAGILYGYLIPDQMKTERNLRMMRGQIGNVQRDIDRLLVEFDQLEEQQARFDALRDEGFFNEQNRREAEDLLRQIQDSAKVVSAVANINPGELEENTEAAKAGHRVLRSNVEITIEALDDIDVYRYLYLLEEYFPGHISFQKIEMIREKDVNAAVLRAVASGMNPPLVKAEIDLAWRTMIPESKVR